MTSEKQKKQYFDRIFTAYQSDKKKRHGEQLTKL